ncbi:metabotropic glutamate receptor 7-like [Haliotis rubra]|uniref:metabotropic glutamate receptor 7-like n=1 Tax=Haliotis rubra TaxID=36100 RepID=UPI001EE52445|nr:metabotropic glutamate receptor 7-like [Haliotis rubra]
MATGTPLGVCISVLLISALLLLGIHSFPDDVYDSKYSTRIDGDINLGAVFSIHASKDGRCSDSIFGFRAIEYFEAVRFAISEINNSSDILSNITLGATILDDCFLASMALARAMQFMPEANRLHVTCNDSLCEDRKLPKFYDVVGVLGAYTSSLSIVVANVMTLFKIPQISHTATSDLLSDKKKFPYFLRMVPADQNQVKVIADVLQYFNWSYVSVVFSEGSYGQESEKKLKPLLRQIDICVAQSIELRDGMSEDDYDDVITSLRRFTTAKVVVLYADIRHTTFIMKAVKRTSASREFIWIGSDGLSVVLNDHLDMCKDIVGSLAVRPYSSTLPRFMTYMKTHLQARKFTKEERKKLKSFDQWFCFEGDESGTEVDEILDNSTMDRVDYIPKFAASYVVDAVYAFATALDAYIKDACPTARGKDVQKCINTETLLQYVKKVEYEGSIGKISFDQNGDVVGKLDVRQCQVVDGVPLHQNVGMWDMRTAMLNINETFLQWPRFTNGSEGLPHSVCAEPCSVGEIATFPRENCCWTCVICKDNEVTSSNSTQCQACDEFFWPDNQTRKSCLPLDPTYVRMSDPIAIVLFFFTLVGLSITTFVILFFHNFRKERIIRSSSRELSQMMLVGICAAYLLVFGFLTFPNNFSCYVNNVGFSLTFTLVYVPLLVKTNRIYRIFRAGKKTTVLPRCTSSSSQVVIVTGLLTFQVILVTVSTSFAPPRVTKSMPVRTEKLVELYCDMPLVGLLSSLSFNLVLVIICVFYAFKTRRLPDNYNESRYIAFCVDTTLLVWISFVPTYFTTSLAYYKVIILSIALIVNSSVCLLCLFIPKVYALYQQKQTSSGTQDRCYNPLNTTRKDTGICPNRFSNSDFFTSKSSFNMAEQTENHQTGNGTGLSKHVEIVLKPEPDSSPGNSELSVNCQ